MIVWGCWVVFFWWIVGCMFSYKKFRNQEDGCVCLILEFLLNILNVFIDFE